MDYIEETQLIQIGSRVDYQTYFLFDKNFDIETFREDIQPRLRLDIFSKGFNIKVFEKISSLVSDWLVQDQNQWLVEKRI